MAFNKISALGMQTINSAKPAVGRIFNSSKAPADKVVIRTQNMAASVAFRGPKITAKVFLEAVMSAP